MSFIRILGSYLIFGDGFDAGTHSHNPVVPSPHRSLRPPKHTCALFHPAVGGRILGAGEFGGVGSSYMYLLLEVMSEPDAPEDKE